MPQKAQKKDNLPVSKVDVDLQNGGTINYANEVIATIAGVAANEIDGIAGMCVSGGFGEILSRNKNITRGVKVEVGSQEAAVDLYIIVEYGKPIQKVCEEVQENVRRALESLTGLHVVRVDVHVQGVSFEKEKKANQNSLEAAKNPVLEAPAEAAEPPMEEPAPETPETPAEEAAPENAEEDAEFDAEVLAEEAEVDGAAEEEAPAAEKAVEETPAEVAAEEKPAMKQKKKAPGGQPKEKPEKPRRPGGRVRA